MLTCSFHRKNPEVREWVQVLKQRYAGKKIIVGRDKLDEVQVLHSAYEIYTSAEPAGRAYGIRFWRLKGFWTSIQNFRRRCASSFVNRTLAQFPDRLCLYKLHFKRLKLTNFMEGWRMSCQGLIRDTRR